MKTSWEIIEGRRTNYVDVHYNEVVIGSHYGTGMSDNAGSCSHREFLEGEYQGLILETFGKEVLDEVVYAVEHSHENPNHNEKRAKINKIKEFIEAIPIDKSLLELKNSPDFIDGFNVYGNRGGYRSYIESDTTSFTYQSTKGVFKNKSTGKKTKVQMDFHMSSCVELHDYYYLIGNDNLYVLSPEGTIVFTTEKKTIEDCIFGYEIRINRVFKSGEIITFSYWAFDSELIPRGLIRYELGKGLMGRIELEE
ncbi:MAG: hypothetical protein ACTSR8_06765 [Promethearchaeota archaeon]